ncbi:MAG TPA: Uma2 family endonuclease [Blastocatellia bacterium]|nr:Uma2 family endonuclease [Blastocatellia bacterium]
MVAVPKERLTIEEYIEFDKNSEERWEYFDGDVVSMSGGTLAHNRITTNFVVGLQGKAIAKGCEVLAGDMRIKVPKAPPYRYADIVVVCGPPVIEKVQGLDVLVNPSLIIEILSPSTEAYNRGQKFVSYKSIDTFREYLLVAQDRPLITHYVRDENGNWLRTDIEGLDNEIELVTLSCTMSLREIYALVDFPADEV